MRVCRAAILVAVLFSLITSVLAGDLPLDTKAKQKVAMEGVLAELETHYGMIKFKEKHFGVTFDKVRAKYTRLIDDAMTLEEEAGYQPRQSREILPPDEFRQMLIGLATEFRDGHTNILRQSKDFYTVGLATAAIQGRLYVAGFDKDYYRMENASEPVILGDEIVRVNGRPVEELARENMLYMSRATEDSRLQEALEGVLEVSNRWFRAKKAGESVEVEFARDQGAGKPAKIIRGSFPWVNRHDLQDLRMMMAHVRPQPPLPGKTPYVFGRRGTTSYFKEGLASAALPTGSVVDLGKLQNTEITEAAQEKMGRADKDPSDLRPITRLEAYTIRYKGKNFGVIRVPDYSPADHADVEKEFFWLGKIIEKMENTTDGLIFDQLTNGGGYVDAGVRMAQLFAPAGGLEAVTIDIRLNETLLQTWYEISPPSPPGHPIPDMRDNFTSVYLSKAVADRMRQKLAGGNAWSGSMPYMGNVTQIDEGAIGKIHRYAKSFYTKPVLLLNDHRSASCGDFVPSILQANRRVLVMGETSMGLGGPLYRNQASMPGSEVTMRSTMGYCERSDELPMENVGVVPEIARSVETRDLVTGFREYSLDVLDAAQMMLDGKKAAEIGVEMEKRRVERAAEKMPDSWKEIQKYVDLMDAWDRQVELTPHERAGVYRGFFASLKAAEGSHETKSPGDRLVPLTLQLPVTLTQEDVILASLHDKGSVLNRLREMTGLARYADPGNQELLSVMVEGISALKRIRFAPALCERLLVGR